MVEVEWESDSISYLFKPNRATLQRSSGFFPSAKSLPQQRCRLETRKRSLFETGKRFTVLVSLKKP